MFDVNRSVKAYSILKSYNYLESYKRIKLIEYKLNSISITLITIKLVCE